MFFEFIISLFSLRAICSSPWTDQSPLTTLETKQIMGLPPGADFNYRSFNISLNQTQANNNYQLVFTFNDIIFTQFQNKIGFGIYGEIKSQSIITLSVAGIASGRYLALIKITFLTIPSKFSNIVTTLHILHDYINQRVAAGSSLILNRVLPLQITEPDYVFSSYLTIFDILSQSPQKNFGLQFSVQMTSTKDYRMTLKNIGNSAITYYYLDRIFIIAYPSRLPKMSRVSIDYIYYPNTQLSMDIINDKNTILGIVGFIFKNGADFRWSLIEQKASVLYGSNTQTSWMVFTLNIFNNSICSGLNPYIDIINNKCQSQCPVNTNVSNCFPCLKNSLYDSTRNICVECPPQSVLNHVTEVCELCQNNTFLDTSSNSCRQCPQYTILNSQYICQPCPDNSYYNKVSKTCKSCGYEILNKETGLCEKCPDGQYLDLKYLACKTLQSDISDQCVGHRGLHYTLSIDWAARKLPINRLISTQSCQARIIFNGEAIGSISPKDYLFHRSQFPVLLQNGDNIITIEGTSYEDTFGLIIGQVTLTSQYNTTNLIVNHDFSSNITSVPSNYPGWYAQYPQISRCSDYTDQFTSFNYSSSSRCIELQQLSNQNYSQTIKISSTIYCSLLKVIQKSYENMIDIEDQAESVRFSLQNPIRTYFSTPTFRYQSCSIDCYTCSNSSICLTCSLDIDYRELNNKTGRCVPIPGYSESRSSSIALRCADYNCVSCFKHHQFCQQCQSSYIMFNNSCLQCTVDNCVTCKGDNVCLECAQGYTTYNNSCKQCSILECNLKAVKKEADDQMAYLGLGVILGLALELALIGIIVLFKDNRSKVTIYPSPTSQTNQVNNIYQDDENISKDSLSELKQKDKQQSKKKKQFHSND